MAEPMVEVVKGGKKEVIQNLKKTLNALDMDIIGSKYDLGLVSFKADSEIVYYAHIVEQNTQESRIALAPGIPYLGECDQSVMPSKIFNRLIKKFNFKMK